MRQSRRRHYCRTRHWRRSTSAAGLILLVYGDPLLAAAIAAPAQPKPTFVTVRTVAPEPVEGVLSSFSISDGAILQVGSERERIAADRIINIQFEHDARSGALLGPQQSPETRLAPLWVLSNADQIRGFAHSGAEDAVFIDCAIGQLRCPLDRLRRYLSAGAQGPSARETLEWFEREPASEDDAILLTNGDVVRGLVRSVDREGFDVESESGVIRAPFRLVLAVRFANPAAVTGGKVAARLSLVDGSFVTAEGLDISEGEVSAAIGGGPRHHFALDKVNAVEIAGGQWEWLSLHPVSSFQHTPMLGLGFEFQLDRNVFEAGMRVAGRSYDRGIGVHSRSRLSYDLKSRYSALVTYFGLDDSAGEYADVDVVVVIDGQRRFEHKGLRRGTLVGPVRLDLTDASRLELLVDYGRNGDVQDRFNWVEPGLILAR